LQRAAQASPAYWVESLGEPHACRYRAIEPHPARVADLVKVLAALRFHGESCCLLSLDRGVRGRRFPPPEDRTEVPWLWPTVG
jgi:hypothetical protein